MFRQLKDSFDRYGKKQQHRQQLPIGSFRHPPASTFGVLTSSITSSFRSNNNNNDQQHQYGMRTSQYDGSASSINTPWAVQRTWQRTDKPVRVTYICILVGILMIWYGIRWISYSNGSINLNCHSIACDIIIYPIGFQKKIQLANIPRQQLVNVQPVKTYQNGTFVTDQNIQLNDIYNNNKKNKHKKYQGSSYSKSASYKGPDKNGHYLSYAFIFQDKSSLNDDQQRRIGMIDIDENQNTNDNNITTIPEVDLQPILPFMEKMNDDNQQQQQKYRLIPKLFGTRHSQRRVRAMVNKIETYIRNRRHKLVVIETASPAWQGIVLIVIGSVTILITCTLGQFTNDTYIVNYRGPGSLRNGGHTMNNRRGQLLQKHNPSPSATIAKRQVTLQSIHQIATPSQYEVNTAATNRPATTAKTISRPPTTTTTNNTTTTNMQANPNMSYRKTIASAHARNRVTQ